MFFLRPLFRYSDWRDAWVLRLVGETFGPVLRTANAPRAWTGLDELPDQPPTLIRRRSGTLAIVAVLGVAVLGFVIARTTGGSISQPAATRLASSGMLEVSPPAGWRRQSPQTSQQFGLTDEIALIAPAPGGGLIVGRIAGPGSSPLPPTLVATLQSTPGAEAVALGGATFNRYLSSARADGRPESVYTLTTTVGTVVGLCLEPAPRSSCEQLLGTLRVSSGAQTAGPSESYAAALGGAIGKLNLARSRAGTQLSGARDAGAQAAAATALAAAHAEAASAVLALNAGPASAANSALAHALQTTATAYTALAQAASRGDQHAYAVARAALVNDAQALNSAFAELRTYGYHVD